MYSFLTNDRWVTGGSSLLPLTQGPPVTTFERHPGTDPSWAPRKGHFHLELPLSWALKEKRQFSAPSWELGAGSRRASKNEHSGLRHQTTLRSSAVGRGGRHLLAAGEKCVAAHSPFGPPEEAVLRTGSQGPGASCNLLLRVSSRAFQRRHAFTCQRCVTHCKSLTLQIYTEGQPLC